MPTILTVMGVECGGSTHMFIPDSLAVTEAVEALTRVGRACAARASPTSFVRDSLNPAVAAWADAIESEILTPDEGFSATLATLAVSIVALQIAASTGGAKLEHREGLVLDYTRVLTRVLRTGAAKSLAESITPTFHRLLNALARVSDELREVDVGNEPLFEFVARSDVRHVFTTQPSTSK